MMGLRLKVGGTVCCRAAAGPQQVPICTVHAVIKMGMCWCAQLECCGSIWAVYAISISPKWQPDDQALCRGVGKMTCVLVPPPVLISPCRMVVGASDVYFEFRLSVVFVR